VEVTRSRALYERLGGHMAEIVPVEALLGGLGDQLRVEAWMPGNPWPFRR
jgi:hypothetical protein